MSKVLRRFPGSYEPLIPSGSARWSAVSPSALVTSRSPSALAGVPCYAAPDQRRASTRLSWRLYLLLVRATLPSLSSLRRVRAYEKRGWITSPALCLVGGRSTPHRFWQPSPGQQYRALVNLEKIQRFAFSFRPHAPQRYSGAVLVFMIFLPVGYSVRTEKRRARVRAPFLSGHRAGRALPALCTSRPRPRSCPTRGWGGWRSASPALPARHRGRSS